MPWTIPLSPGCERKSPEKEVFGRKRTIVITRSRALLRGQIPASGSI